MMRIGISGESALLCVSLIAHCFLSCSNTVTTDSGGTETVNCYATLSTGQPAPNAVIRAIDAYSWKDSIHTAGAVILDSVVSGSDGHFTMTLPSDNRCVNIQIDGLLEGAFAPGMTVDNLDGDIFHLQPYSSCDVSFDSPDVGQLFLSGSAYRAQPGATGTFTLSNIAVGDYTLVGQSGTELVTCGSVSLSAGQSAAVTGVAPSADRILLDDFGGTLGPSALGRILPGLYWYTFSDSGSSRWNAAVSQWDWAPFLNPSGSGHSMARINSAVDSVGNTALSFEATFDNSSGYSWAGTGVNLLRYSPEGIDLSAMTGVSFRCKGEGSLILSIETYMLQTATDSLSNFAYVIELSDTWTDYQVSIDSLTIYPAVGNPAEFPWSDAARRVEQIEFFYASEGLPLQDTLSFKLDDLYLDGIRLGDVGPADVSR